MEVLVVGAGVAGLTLAIGLKQHGVKVTVVERAADLGPVCENSSLHEKK